MFDENLNPNEGSEEVVNLQEEQVNESTENVNEEVVPSQENEKPVQSAEDNAKYASIRRQAQQEAQAQTQQAIDAEYSRLYGESNGIHTKADYDKAVKEYEREQQIQADAESQGVSEEYIRRLKDVEDTVATTKAEKQEIANQKAELERQIKMIAEHDELSKDESFGDYYSQYADSIKENANKWGVDLNTSMLMSLRDNFKAFKEGTSKKAQQDTINNIIKNGKSSPGSLASTQNPSSDSVANMSDADFKAYTERALRGELKKS